MLKRAETGVKFPTWGSGTPLASPGCAPRPPGTRDILSAAAWNVTSTTDCWAWYLFHAQRRAAVLNQARKPIKAFKGSVDRSPQPTHYSATHRHYVNVVQSNITFLFIFAVLVVRYNVQSTLHVVVNF